MPDRLDPLARYTLAGQQGRTASLHDALYGVWQAARGEDDDGQRILGLPTSDQVTADDLITALHHIPEERNMINAFERDMIAALMDRLGTWDAVGAVLGQRGDAARLRYRRLGGTRTWPAGRPAATRTPPGADD